MSAVRASTPAAEIVTLEGSGFAATTGSAVGKTMVASTLTAGRSKGRKGRERTADRSLWEETGKLIPSPERASTFPVMKVPYLFILPKRLDRDILEQEKGRWRRENIDAAENDG